MSRSSPKVVSAASINSSVSASVAAGAPYEPLVKCALIALDAARAIAGVVRSHSSAQRVSRREDGGGVLQNVEPNHADHYQVGSVGT